MSDFLLYGRLKIRHYRSSMLRMLSGILFSDFAEDNGLGERIYQLYALGIMALWFLLMWFFALDFSATLFMDFGPDISHLVLSAICYVPALLFVIGGIQYLKTSPWKLSPADIPFVVSSSLSLSGVIMWEALVQLLVSGGLGFLAGFLLGFGFVSSGALVLDPWVFALLVAILVCGALVWAWVLGVMRLTVTFRKTSRYPLVIGSIGLLAVVVFGLLLILGSFLSQGMPYLTFLPSSLAILCLGFALLLLISRYVDATKVVEENALHLDMYRFRNMSLYDSVGHAEILRQKKVAKRGPLFHVPIAAGTKALVSRSLLSHLRQFEGIPWIMFWGIGAAPMAAFLILSPVNPLFWMVWIQMLLLMQKGVREITRVFRDDLKNSSIRDHLPFATLSLFMHDCAVPFAACLVVSIIATGFTLAWGSGLVVGLAICLSCNCALVLCAGVDGLSFFQTQKSMSYEIALLILIAGVFLMALSGVVISVPCFLVLYSVSLAALMKYSSA